MKLIEIDYATKFVVCDMDLTRALKVLTGIATKVDYTGGYGESAVYFPARSNFTISDLKEGTFFHSEEAANEYVARRNQESPEDEIKRLRAEIAELKNNSFNLAA